MRYLLLYPLHQFLAKPLCESRPRQLVAEWLCLLTVFFFTIQVCSASSISGPLGHVHGEDVVSLQEFVSSVSPSATVLGTVKRVDLAHLAGSHDRTVSVNVSAFELRPRLSGEHVTAVSASIPLSVPSTGTASATARVGPALESCVAAFPILCFFLVTLAASTCHQRVS